MANSPAPRPTSNELAEQRTTLAGDRTAMALDRTRLAHERTLMAWVRTATSLISFGFTIYKFFQGLTDAERLERPVRLFGPRGYGMVMIGLGVGALVFATIQHRAELQKINAEYARYGTPPRSNAMMLAMVIGALGVVALVLVIFRQ
jgi:putative membrane protein